MAEIIVVMIEPENQGNIGAVARSMKNFELRQLYLINPKDEIGVDARKMASHAQDVLGNAKILKNLKELKKECSLLYGTTAISAKRPSNLTRNALTPSEFASLISSTDGKIAILFGRESRGLSNRELDYCDAVITIPANILYSTLNVSTAAAIIFYEIYKKIGRITLSSTIDLNTKENLLKRFKGIISKTNLPDYKRSMIEQAFKNTIGKSSISRKEAGLLLTALNRIDIELTKGK
jgi:TrmH family RNA methyltransferase